MSSSPTETKASIVSFYVKKELSPSEKKDLSNSKHIAGVVCRILRLSENDLYSLPHYMKNQMKYIKDTGKHVRTNCWYLTCLPELAQRILLAADDFLIAGYLVSEYQNKVSPPSEDQLPHLFIHMPRETENKQYDERVRGGLYRRIEIELNKLVSLGVLQSMPKITCSQNWYGGIENSPIHVEFEGGVPLDTRRFVMMVLQQSYVRDGENHFVCSVSPSWLRKRPSS